MNKMKNNNLILILSLIFIISCTKNDKNGNATILTIENIKIPMKWIESPDRNQPKVTDFNELKTIHLTH
jgi:hypothetical protein